MKWDIREIHVIQHWVNENVLEYLLEEKEFRDHWNANIIFYEGVRHRGTTLQALLNLHFWG